MKKRFIQSVIFTLLVTMLTTGFGWAFNGEVFAHELDRKHHTLSLDPVALQQAHELEASNDGKHVDAAIDLCLHAAGQYQPFFFTIPPLVPASMGMEALPLLVPVAVPESIPDSPLHPPRNTFAS